MFADRIRALLLTRLGVAAVLTLVNSAFQGNAHALRKDYVLRFVPLVPLVLRLHADQIRAGMRMDVAALTPVLLLKFVLQANACASREPGAQERSAEQIRAGMRMGAVVVLRGMFVVQTKHNASRARCKEYVLRRR